MSNSGGYFDTDWAAMTLHDWIGLIITVIIFLLMVGLYVYVLNPKNKDKLEKQRHLPDEDDDDRSGTEEHK